MAESSVNRCCGVYQILNVVTGKRYIGSSRKFEARFYEHRYALRQGTHHSKYLQASWTKYGEDSFRFEPILICAREDLIFFEQRAMDSFSVEYNTLRVAGSSLGAKASPETRAKRSLLNMGNKFCVGRIPSELCRQRVAEANRKRKGLKRLRSAVEATAAAHRGMKRSPETRAKISERAKARWARR